MKLQMSEHNRVRIYTVPKVAAKLDGTFSNITTIDVNGYWLGVPEPAVIVEIVSDDEGFLDRMVEAFGKAAADLGEAAILVTWEKIEARLLWTSQAWIESLK